MVYGNRYQIKNIPVPYTGLNNKDDASEILDSEISDAQNVEVDSRSLKSAAGFVDYGGDTGPFHGAFQAVFQDGSNILIRQRQKGLEYDDGDGTWSACTLPEVDEVAIELTEVGGSFVMMNDIILWSNGEDTVMSSTDGITWTLQGDLPKSKVLFDNGFNRIVFLAQPAAPSKVSWSNINDPLTVGATSYQFIGKNDGQEIIDAVLLPNGSILLLKTNRFYSISDITSNMLSVDPIGEAPCVRYTAVATENSAIWAGPDGKIYEFDGLKASVISSNIVVEKPLKPEAMRAIYSNGKYRLAIPILSNNYNTVEYVVNRHMLTNIPLNPYVITKNTRNIGCYMREMREVNATRRDRIYIGDSTNGSIFAYINESHDQSVTQGLNGEVQHCYFVTKFFTDNASFYLKRFVKYFLRMKSTNDVTIRIKYRFDQFGQWIESEQDFFAEELDFLLEDNTYGGFEEDFSFSTSSIYRIFESLEKGDIDIDGIQFKIEWESISDIEILAQGYKYLIKPNFH